MVENMENEIPDLPAMLDKFDNIMAEEEDTEELDGLFEEEDEEAAARAPRLAASIQGYWVAT